MKTSATCQDRLWKRVYGDFERSMESVKRRSGGDGGVETPVPIPNTEVKHPSGDDSWPCACENSSLPGLFFVLYENRTFLFLIKRIFSTKILISHAAQNLFVCLDPVDRVFMMGGKIFIGSFKTIAAKESPRSR